MCCPRRAVANGALVPVKEDGGLVQTPSCRGIDAWPEDPEDLRRTADILGQITRDTHDNDSGVSLDLLVKQAVRLVPNAEGARPR